MDNNQIIVQIGNFSYREVKTPMYIKCKESGEYTCTYETRYYEIINSD